MKPNKPTARSRSAVRHRVQVLLQDGLGWMRGYPTGSLADDHLPWRIIPPAGSGHPRQELRIDGATLAKATRIRNQLYRKFPRGLPRVVGDRERWYRSVTARLELLKTIVNHRGKLPPLAQLLERSGLPDRDRVGIEALSGSAPDLANGIYRISWIHWRSNDLRPAVSFLLEHAEMVRRLTSVIQPDRLARLILVLADLAVSGRPRSGERILVSLSHPVSFRAPLDARVQSDETQPYTLAVQRANWRSPHHARRLEWPQASPARCGPPIVDLVLRLSRLDPERWSRGLSLLEVLLPEHLLDRWHAYWQHIHDLRELADTRYGAPTGGLTRIHHRLNLIKRFRALETRGRPPAYSGHNVCNSILAMVKKADLDSEEAATIVEALSDLPETVGDLTVRARFFEIWQELSEDFDWRALLPIVEATRTFLRDPETTGPRVRFWRDILSGRRGIWTSLETRVLDGDTEGVRYQDVCDTHGATLRLDPAVATTIRNDDEIDRFRQSLLAFRGDPKRSAAAICHLAARGQLPALRGLDDHQRRAAVRLSSAQPDLLSDLLPTVARLSLDRSDRGGIDAVSALEDLRHVVASLLVLGEGARALRLLRSVHHLELLRVATIREDIRACLDQGPRTPSSSPPAWIERYPAALHDHLRHLDREDPAAGDIARRLLKDDFPDPDDLDQQIETLRRRLEGTQPPSETLRRRLAKLERLRTGGERQTSGQRILKLQRKLERRAFEARVVRVERLLRRRFADGLAARIGHPIEESCWSEPRDAWLLVRVLALPPRYRTLGVSLFTRVVRFREHPANQAFLRRMEARGLRLGPWMDEPRRLERKLPDGTRITIRREDDPVQVLRMGEPFQTCLSPGDFNFHSAVLNAVDVNKQVLYARDQRERIVARCLLALTTEGRVLTFYVYSHLRRDTLSPVFAEYVRELARDMGTTPIPRGQVDELVETGWYDDGPVDLTGRFSCFEKQSEFRRSLKLLTPEEFRTQLEEALAPDPLDAGTLPLVLHLSELDEHPGLVGGLLEAIRSADGLPSSSRIRAASLLRRGGTPRAAREVLAPILRARKQVRRLCDMNSNLIEELIDLGDPHTAIQVLYRTRPRGVHRWQDEDTWDRLPAAIRAFEALNRTGMVTRLQEVLSRRQGSRG